MLISRVIVIFLSLWSVANSPASTTLYYVDRSYPPRDSPCERPPIDTMHALSIEASLVQYRYDKLMGARRIRASKPPDYVNREDISAPSADSGFHSAVIWEELSRDIGVDFVLTWYDGEFPHPRYLIGWGECGSMYLLRGFDANHYWQMAGQECEDCSDRSVMGSTIRGYLELSWSYPDIHEVLDVAFDSADASEQLWFRATTREVYDDNPGYVHRIALKACGLALHEIDTLAKD